ncbi:S-adenosyl-L-methionine-dependent methyltransferase [Globomyces pollinis-pini]|nr:S-adenosyl-L-methionine-dependent methyltransferase [Globomyces pollinis-pini]
MTVFEEMIESAWIPDIAIRIILRIIIYFTKLKVDSDSEIKKLQLIQHLKSSEINLNVKDSNTPYEFPTDFFTSFLGQSLKYSSCYFDKYTLNLDEAEINMFEIYIKQSGLKDGMTILDIGCGWGSFCMYLIKQFPNCKILGLTHSNAQVNYIKDFCKLNGIKNLEAINADVCTVEISKKFDRIFAVEVLEYMKNYELLFQRLSNWLTDDGYLYTHVFAHRDIPFELIAPDQDSWISKFFCRGGTLPSQDLFLWFQKDLLVMNRWTFDGTHYSKTANEWIKNMDENQSTILTIFKNVYGSNQEAFVWFRRWRFFVMLVAELFGSNNGHDWLIVHYLMKRRK